MSVNDRCLRSLFKIIRSWGGQVEELNKVTYKEYDRSDHLLKAPFTCSDLAIDWESKIFFYTTSNMPWWPEVIHEMGHVFASGFHPNDNSCNENDFFSWEYYLARRIRGPINDWYKSNYDYQVDSCSCNNCSSTQKYIEFGSLARDCQRRCIKRYTKAGLQKEIIATNRYFKNNRIEYVPVPTR